MTHGPLLGHGSNWADVSLVTSDDDAFIDAGSVVSVAELSTELTSRATSVLVATTVESETAPTSDDRDVVASKVDVVADVGWGSVTVVPGGAVGVGSGGTKALVFDSAPVDGGAGGSEGESVAVPGSVPVPAALEVVLACPQAEAKDSSKLQGTTNPGRRRAFG